MREGTPPKCDPPLSVPLQHAAVMFSMPPLWDGNGLDAIAHGAAGYTVQNPVPVATWWLHEKFKAEIKKPRAIN